MRFRYVLSISMIMVVWWNTAMINRCTQKKVKEDIVIVKEIPSPSGQYIATIYHVSGGGAAGYAYRLVNIRKKDEPFNPETEIVFQWTGTDKVTLKWESERESLITYPPIANVYTKADVLGEIKIKYLVE